MVLDWTKIYSKYRGLWVALKDDQKTVISSGKTVNETVQKAKKKGIKEPTMFRVPDKSIPYVGGASLM